MPRTYVVFYREPKGEVPVLEWLAKLRKTNQRAYASCVAAVEHLATSGHELRRPLADLLRDGIYELRIRKGRVHYRILYFFHGRDLAILGMQSPRRMLYPMSKSTGACGVNEHLNRIRKATAIRNRSASSWQRPKMH
jgi:phage-related protein